MPHSRKGPRLGAAPAHETLMLANLATSLFRHVNNHHTHRDQGQRLRSLPSGWCLASGVTASLAGYLRRSADKTSFYTISRLRSRRAPRFDETRPGGYNPHHQAGALRKGDAAPRRSIELLRGTRLRHAPTPPNVQANGPQVGPTDAVAALASRPTGRNRGPQGDDGHPSPPGRGHEPPIQLGRRRPDRSTQQSPSPVPAADHTTRSSGAAMSLRRRCPRALASRSHGLRSVRMSGTTALSSPLGVPSPGRAHVPSAGRGTPCPSVVSCRRTRA